ncbi:putative dihydroxy-acid dehydratase [Phaeomoniella chlamydospora]|uniref:Putative dihydroxy-acid dehydratase n=1 Tax=Phaeomoniella chlamydospora TaxID=158046 RepID=A0A0G2GEV2_PHACM|nr:putative dihydroxy-acid dehydratase [Phaeomoniella chlamydospora]
MASHEVPASSSSSDYDLSQSISSTAGLRQGLTSYGDAHFSLYLRKVFIKALGYSEDALSRPIIGIINTYSSFNPCHANVPQLIDAAKRGVQLNGGLAIDFPTISLHESFSSPTSMFLRNLMAMDTEEMIKAQPVDACIMIGAGELDIEEISDINEQLAPTTGTCGVMGTASTMACITAALGLMPLRGASAPAVSATRLRIAEETGANAVAVAAAKRRPQDLLTKESFINAIIVLQAIGGSTNAIVHLMAIINRHPYLQGVIDLDTFDEIGRRTPLLVDLKPSGDNYMTDFHNAGGMLALLHKLRPLLHLDARTISGKTLGQVLDAAPFRTFPFSEQVIRPLSNPLYSCSSLIVLRGNLAPQGAVMKASASKDRRLLKHSGPAVVFDGPADLAKKLDDPFLDITENSVLVLKGIGPIGNPGMPEAGLIPLPRKLAAKGVKDMLRISDGRMSGTAGGTIVLHISPESARNESAFAVLRDGDIISCDADQRRIEVDISEEEVIRRLKQRSDLLAKEGKGNLMTERLTRRGYRGLYERCVNQAHEGADFDFLTAAGPGALEETW